MKPKAETPRANPFAAPTPGKDALKENIQRRNRLDTSTRKPGLLERYSNYVAKSSKSPSVGEIQTRLKTEAAQKKQREEAAAKKRADDYRKANRGWEFGMKAPGKAAGGKIDGCAIRGKTRAPLKKGK
jgi:hypothetical protein